MKVLKFLSLSLFLLLLTVSGEEVSVIDSVSIPVNEDDIHAVAYSIPSADKWVKANILNGKAPPATVVVVGGGFLCDANYEDHWSSILPAIQNLHFSLARRGLQKRIMVSTVLPTECLDAGNPPSKFKPELADSLLKPLLNFLQNTNSLYLLQPSSYLSLTSHKSAIEEMGISLDIHFLKENIIKSRKLISEPLPSHPSAVQRFASSPSSFSVANPPSLSFSFPPGTQEPVNFPSSPPVVSAPPSDGLGLPPCVPVHREPNPARYGLWCVAKPTVPEDTLQEAMDYACGDGGAECEEIMPQGNCFYPDTVAAHASYAFNSYWQKAKNNGGTCDFSGTAMLITSDPSFLHCHYVFS